ncbi:MAG: hypothetical protein AAB150_07215 [Pseudomonadota bacterium]
MSQDFRRHRANLSALAAHAGGDGHDLSGDPVGSPVRPSINLADNRVATRSFVHGVITADDKAPEVYNTDEKKPRRMGEVKFCAVQEIKKNDLPVALTLHGFWGYSTLPLVGGLNTSINQAKETMTRNSIFANPWPLEIPK